MFALDSRRRPRPAARALCLTLLWVLSVTRSNSSPILAPTKLPIPARTKLPIPVPTKLPILAPTKLPIPVPTKLPIQARAPKGGWWPLLGCTAPFFFTVAAAIALWAFSAANRCRPKAPAGGKGTRVYFPTLRLELFVVFAFLRVSPTSAGVPTPLPTLGYSYIGCYTDCGDGGSRDLSVFGGVDYSSMTAGYCATLCSGYAYFGTQYARECWCGDSYGSFGTSAGCTSSCTGDATEVCGGACANSVYKQFISPTKLPIVESSTALSTLETSAETPKSAPFQRLLSGTLTGSCDFDVDTCTYSNTGSYSWTRDASGTSSGSTGPSGDHTSGSGYYMYTEASSPNYPNVGPFVLESAVGAGAGYAEFWYHMYGSTMGTLNFDASSDDGTTWTTLWTLSGNQGNVWRQAGVEFDSSTTDVRFSGTTGSSWTGDMAIDDVAVYPAPPTALPIPAPTNVPTLDPTTSEDSVVLLLACTCQSACLPPDLYLTRPLSRRCFASPGNMKSTTSLMGVLILAGLAHRMRTKSP
jgi:hypothetical protein